MSLIEYEHLDEVRPEWHFGRQAVPRHLPRWRLVWLKSDLSYRTGQQNKHTLTGRGRRRSELRQHPQTVTLFTDLSRPLSCMEYMDGSQQK